MDTIRNYLESMFKNLPQTEKVIKAKYELSQMMEDKYVELIKEGKSENEAVGTVISEFGNLEELASDLGIEDIYKINKTVNRRKLSLDEIKQFFEDKKQAAILKALGIAFCIICVTGPICADAFHINDGIGVLIMFLLVAAGISLMIVSGQKSSNWDFLSKEACAIEPYDLDYVKDLHRKFLSVSTTFTAVGISLCILSFVPAAVFDEYNLLFMEDLSGAFLFIFVAAGVFLLVYSGSYKSSLEKMMNLNSENVNEAFSDFSATENSDKKSKAHYKNSGCKTIMEVYWPTVTCIYLCWSFLACSWYISWILWPIAGVVHMVLKNLLMEEAEETR